MKTETVSIKCDNCEMELITHSSNPAKYIFELKSINTNINDTGSIFTVHVNKPIEQPLHFCSLKCLSEWNPHKDKP